MTGTVDGPVGDQDRLGPRSAPAQRTTAIVGAWWGSTAERGDWLLGAWYARVEALAINASYGQDDWFRWGSSSETASSDFEGYELRFARGFGNGSNLVARLFLAEALTSIQDGKRFPIDYNVKF